MRAAEVARLEAAVATGKTVLATAQAAAASAAVNLDQLTNQLATLQQAASVLQQQLASSTTGPERHRIELELNTNRLAQFQAGLDQLAATTSKAVADGKVARTEAANATADADLQRARQDLAAATADAGADTALAEAVTTDYGGTVARAAAQETAWKQAVTRLGELLGGHGMADSVSRAITVVRTAEGSLGPAAAEADGEMLAEAAVLTPVDTAVTVAAAALEAARATARAATQDAPARVDDAVAVVDAVRAAVTPPEQPTIDAAAAAVVPGDSMTYRAWLVTLPDTLIDTAVALLDDVEYLKTIAGDTPRTLSDALTTTNSELATALAAQTAARIELADKTAEAALAHAALDSTPDTPAARAARHRAAFLRGEVK